MTSPARPPNVVTLKELLPVAEQGHYAIGSFAPRYTPMIRPVLRAAQKMQSPLIVQTSSNDFRRYGTNPAAFAEELYRALEEEQISVPVVLHLDHTQEMDGIRDAIDAGFTSVMMDASDKPLEENIELSKECAYYAHAHLVSTEASLGMTGATGMVETDRDEELFTDPDETGRFANETDVDALAVSVGTTHGIYTVGKPRIDYARLAAIRERTEVHLVLHGGSGVPAEMLARAIKLPSGGISKVNIAADLETAFLQAVGRDKPMSDAECQALPPGKLELGRAAVERIVMDKIANFVLSEGRAADFGM